MASKVRQSFETWLIAPSKMGLSPGEGFAALSGALGKDKAQLARPACQ
ncbi:MAG: hypothetical protein R2865_15900 [Deinococcales bacterium]